MSRTNLEPSEDLECIRFVSWLRLKDLKFSHIPNGMFTNSWRVRKKNKMLGVARGVPDYLIITPRHGVIFVEMKRQRTYKTSAEQKEWIEALTEVGCPAKVCRGFSEAKAFVEEWL